MKKLPLIILFVSLFSCVTAPPSTKEWAWIPDDSTVVGTFDTSMITHPEMIRTVWSKFAPSKNEPFPDLRFIEQSLGVFLSQVDRITMGLSFHGEYFESDPVVVLRFKSPEGWFDGLSKKLELNEEPLGNYKVWTRAYIPFAFYKTENYLLMAKKEVFESILNKTTLGWGAKALSAYSGDAFALAFKAPEKWLKFLPKTLQSLGEMVVSVKIDGGIKTYGSFDLGEVELALAVKDFYDGLGRLGEGAKRILGLFLEKGDIPEGALRTLLAFYYECLTSAPKAFAEVAGTRFITRSEVSFDKLETYVTKMVKVLRETENGLRGDMLENLDDIFNPFKKQSRYNDNQNSDDRFRDLNDSLNEDHGDWNDSENPEVLEDLEGEKDSAKDNNQDLKGEKVAP